VETLTVHEAVQVSVDEGAHENIIICLWRQTAAARKVGLNCSQPIVAWFSARYLSQRESTAE
jgi:hypothetical protein